MIIKNIYNTTLDRITNKEHNIYIGISIGNKYFTKERVGAYLDWAIENSKNPPIIFLADTIQAYNYMAFKGYSEEDALSTAKYHGNSIRGMILRLINYRKINTKIIKDIDIIGVEDIWTKQHEEDRIFLEKEIEINNPFREKIYALMQQMLPEGKLNKDNIKTASKYILSELPIQYNIKYKGTHYDLYPYPGKIVSEFLNDIQNRKIFPEVALRLHIPKATSFVESYIEE
jgi:tRNA-dependent cyclodipeptide synthase